MLYFFSAYSLKHFSYSLHYCSSSFSFSTLDSYSATTLLLCDYISSTLLQNQSFSCMNQFSRYLYFWVLVLDNDSKLDEYSSSRCSQLLLWMPTYLLSSVIISFCFLSSLMQYYSDQFLFCLSWIHYFSLDCTIWTKLLISSSSLCKDMIMKLLSLSFSYFLYLSRTN